MTVLYDVIRGVPGGGAEDGVVVTIYQDVPGADTTTELGEVTTDASGEWGWEYDVAGMLAPGPIRWEATDSSGRVRKSSSRALGVSGPTSFAENVYLLRALGDGVVDGDGGELAVSQGTGTTVSIATGMCVVDGLPLRNKSADTNLNLGIVAASASNTRIDTVAVRVDRFGQDWEGRGQFVRVAGTQTTGTPAPPTLANTTQYAYLRLADVLVNSSGIVSVTNATARWQPPPTERGATLIGSAQSVTVTSGITSTTGQSVVSLTQAGLTALPDAAKTYDLIVDGCAFVSSNNTATQVQVAAFYTTPGGVTTYGPWLPSIASTHVPVAASVVATGWTGAAAITCGIAVRRSNTTATVNCIGGFVRAIMVPRS